MAAVGRLALGVVGGLIGAPFGMSALGFSLGMSIGGALFTKPTESEGPRLGDTAVSSSSLGNVIPEHFGVTRANGNIIWSAGLREEKVVEKQGGGGKGGPRAISTTYTYFCSFALSLGYGRAKSVRRIWADSKLIYDGTGNSETDNEKYKFSLHNGGGSQNPASRIAGSINRRLAGVPDINEGSQPQAPYTTMRDLIKAAWDSYQSSGNRRYLIYAEELWKKTTVAESRAKGVDNAYENTTAEQYLSLGNALPTILDAFTDSESNFYSGPVPNYRFTPAYRNIAYIVFADMPLEDFGNRIPNLTAEVVWEGADFLLEADREAARRRIVEVPEIGAAPAPMTALGTDATGGILIAYEPEGGFRRYSLESLSENLRVKPSQDWEIVKLLGIGEDGKAVAVVRFQNGPEKYAVINGRTLRITLLTDPDDTPIGYVGASVPIQDQTTTSQGYHFSVLNGSTLYVMQIDDTATVRETGSVSVPFARGVSSSSSAVLISGKQTKKGHATVYGARADDDCIQIFQCDIKNRDIADGFSPGSTFSIDVKENVVANPFPSAITAVRSLIFDRSTGDLILVVGLSGGATGVARVAFDDVNSAPGRADPTESGGADQWFVNYLRDKPIDAYKFHVSIPFTSPAFDSGFTRSDVSSGSLLFIDGNMGVLVKLTDGTYETTELNRTFRNGPQLYIGDIGGVLCWENSAGGNAQANIVYIGPSGATGNGSSDPNMGRALPEIVATICRRAGLPDAEFDVSQIPDIYVRGFSIARSATARAVLDNLLQAYLVEGAEIDWKVRFRPQGSAPIRTIKQVDLGEVRSGSSESFWNETRRGEHEVPAEINLNYSDVSRDYQTGSAHKRRISNPIPAMYSTSVTNVEVPLVMRPDDALSLAERLLFSAWMSRTTSSTALSWKHIDLDPSDVVRVDFDDGRRLVERLTKMSLGADFSIDIGTERAGDPVFVPSPPSAITTSAVPVQRIIRPVGSDIQLLDIPLIEDFHDTGRSALRTYTTVLSSSPQWRSASLFGSFDNATFTGYGETDITATWGYLNGDIPPPRALWATDNETVLSVNLVRNLGNLSSVTWEELLNGANRAVIWNPSTRIGEIIQFQNVTRSNGIATIRTLLRGRRGTDWAVDKHTDGALFILLPDSAVTVTSTELSRLGQTFYHKAVSAGQLITRVPSKAGVVTGNTLKPWAPTRVEGNYAGGDLSLTWNRRTRIGGGNWTMLPVENVPLSEDLQAYEVYLIRDGATFNVAQPSTYQVMKSVTSPTCNFTAAEIAAAGYSATQNVRVAIYQLSAQVGRGFPAIGEVLR